jgi:hypothetical protein
MKKGRVANFHGQAATSHSFVAWDRSHDVFHKNKLPYICSMYDTGVKGPGADPVFQVRGGALIFLGGIS